MRGKIPQIGNAGFTMEDGTVVSGGGEIMEEIDPNTGRPMLVRRIEEPTELMEKYAELGIPNPFEQYEPEMFMDPAWQGQREELELTRGADAPMWDAWREAKESFLNQPQATPRTTPAAEPEKENRPGLETVGETDIPLEGGEGISADYVEPAPYDAATGAMGGQATPRPSLVEGRQIQDPAQFEQWYIANANRMTDEQRMEMAMWPGTKMGMVSVAEQAGWDEVQRAATRRHRRDRGGRWPDRRH